MKRGLGAKDWGVMIEGHGGMLDRMDSVSFAAPVFFSHRQVFLQLITARRAPRDDKKKLRYLSCRGRDQDAQSKGEARTACKAGHPDRCPASDHQCNYDGDGQPSRGSRCPSPAARRRPAAAQEPAAARSRRCRSCCRCSAPRYCSACSVPAARPSAPSTTSAVEPPPSRLMAL